MIRHLACAAACAATLVAGTAQAATWPASLLGSWTMYANQHQLLFTVTGQSSLGHCQPIGGTILDVASQTTDQMSGFYCPGTGRVSFLRTSPTGVTYQNFSGNLSQQVRGHLNLMSGTLSEDAAPAGVGEYGFYGVR